MKRTKKHKQRCWPHWSRDVLGVHKDRHDDSAILPYSWMPFLLVLLRRFAALGLLRCWKSFWSFSFYVAFCVEESFCVRKVVEGGGAGMGRFRRRIDIIWYKRWGLFRLGEIIWIFVAKRRRSLNYYTFPKYSFALFEEREAERNAVVNEIRTRELLIFLGTHRIHPTQSRYISCDELLSVRKGISLQFVALLIISCRVYSLFIVLYIFFCGVIRKVSFEGFGRGVYTSRSAT